MKRSRAQLNAISRAYANKEYERLEAIAINNNVLGKFHKQDKYKSLRWFLKSLNLL